ncbi:MAG: reverse transcriptase domain-containing protein [Pseudomonadota bacterium]|nr:reverse transcriptase domain-containing protein [Pseudomonadota bacterium]
MQLIKHYLSDRYQYTTTNGHKSSMLPISCGVPQGSVLGPFLFSVVINDLPKATSMHGTMFADDACFSIGHSSQATLERHVNLELSRISTWFQSNKLTLNVYKTCFLLIHRRREKLSLQLSLNGAPISQKEEVKYLGVILDHKLSWKSHINSCTSNLSKCLWAVPRLRRYTNTSTLRLVYYALGYSYLQYGISVYGKACKSVLQPLLVKSINQSNEILFAEYNSPSSPLFLKLNVLKFDDVYTLEITSLMYNQIKKGVITSQNISSLSSVHSYATRSSNNQNFHIPIVKSNLAKNFFSLSRTNSLELIAP